MFDLLFQHATIVDGSGNAAFTGDVAVLDGKIAKIAPEITGEAHTVYDCRGKVLSPGFIDSHSHSDLFLPTDPNCEAKLRQGVTTEIAGQCGITIAPVSVDHFEERNARSVTAAFVKGDRRPFSSTNAWFEYLEKQKFGTNQVGLVGQGTLRETVMGQANRPATPEELEEMKSLLRGSMEAGALGMSSGLAYAPGSFTPHEEIVELCKVVADYHGIYTSHMRNQAGEMLQCVKDSIDVARRTGCGVCISHIKIIGRPNWGHMEEALRLIADARAEGLNVWCDVYPYVAGSTTLTVTLPPSLLAGGTDALLERLKQPETQEYIRTQLAHPTEHWENALGENGYESFLIGSAPETPEAEGKRLSEYAASLGMDPFDAYIKLFLDNHANVMTVNFVMSEEDLTDAISSDFCLIGSDGTYRPGDPIAHPRAIGTFPRFLGRYARDKGLFSLERAVAKLTSQCAACYGLEHRKGLIREGYDADLVVFDPDKILDTSDFVNFLGTNQGINMVVVGGKIAVQDDQYTGVRNGALIRLRA